MSKKLFALVMVTSILGGILAGCGSGSTDADAAKPADTATTAGATTGDATK
ncbi:hypothetical protein BH11ARM2_BH11ARM2_13180 [soil metagenome]